MLEARPGHLPILVDIPAPFQGPRLCLPSPGSPPSLVINPATGEDRRPGPFPGYMAESKANQVFSALTQPLSPLSLVSLTAAGL